MMINNTPNQREWNRIVQTEEKQVKTIFLAPECIKNNERIQKIIKKIKVLRDILYKEENKKIVEITYIGASRLWNAQHLTQHKNNSLGL